MSSPERRSPLRRTLANTAWLIGGKGFGTLCGLAYLAILTRTLGLEGTGHFAMIFGAAQALIAVAGVQTWRVVVRYGARHVHDGDWAAFGRLGLLCGALDAIGAALGCAIAAIVVYGFGDRLGLSPVYAGPAFAFTCAMLWALVSAPTGIVRALDRFDTAVYVEAIVPAGRLLAALAIWWTGPSVGRFLLAWAAIDLLEAACYWASARRLCPEAVRLAHLADWRRALRENPGLERFVVITHVSSTLEAVTRFGPMLAVGALIGASAAGLYSVANQLAQSLSKLSALLTRTVYAEVASVRAASGTAELLKFVVQTSLIAGIAGVAVVGLAMILGGPLLVTISGSAFAGAFPILVALAVAASFELASVAFEPVLHATGRALHALLSRVLAILVLCVAGAALLASGAPGVAWAVVAGAAAGYVAMGTMAAISLRREC